MIVFKKTGGTYQAEVGSMLIVIFGGYQTWQYLVSVKEHPEIIANVVGTWPDKESVLEHIKEKHEMVHGAKFDE